MEQTMRYVVFVSLLTLAITGLLGAVYEFHPMTLLAERVDALVSERVR